jgi:hypothetical protein
VCPRASTVTLPPRTVTAMVACAAAIALSGCASALVAMTGFLNAESARSYAPLKPYEFVKRRFFTEEESRFGRSVGNAVEGLVKAFPANFPKHTGDGRRRPEALDEANMVTWPAYFTDENYFQLLRPVADLKRYCEAREGKFKTLSVDRTDPLQFARNDPQAAFADAYGRVLQSLAAQRAYAGFEELRGQVAMNVGTEIAAEARTFNRTMEGIFSVKGYQMAQRLDGFGTFACEGNDGSTWLASVFSTTIYASQASNSLSSSMSRLAIRVYEPKQDLPRRTPG